MLSKILEDIVEGVDAEQLKLGIKDVIDLRDLRLKANIFDKIGFPFNMKFGYVGSVTVKVPWMNLLSEPLEIKISNVYALLEPRPEAEWDAEKSK
jgi:vacuolar protein sorting-associated protein 13A/C